MIKRDHFETLLKINGLTTESPDEQIIAVLVGAHYVLEEAQEIVSLFRQNITANTIRTDGLHKVFFSDAHLQPQEVSRLLGINVEVTEKIKYYTYNGRPTPMQFVLIWFLSVVIALTGILFYMYLNQIGLFHPILTLPW